MTPLVANGLVGGLEDAADDGAGEGACQAPGPDVAVVLGGAVDAEPLSRADFHALGLTSRLRVEAGVEWWQGAPGRTLVMAGGVQPGYGGPDDASTAELMAAYARRLGVDAGAIRVEPASTNTWENARNVARLSPPPPGNVALVTSAMHMPRAMQAMREAGFTPCPVPTDYRHIPFGLPGYLVPGTSALAKTEAALHERVGLLYYRWLAWRDAD